MNYVENHCSRPALLLQLWGRRSPAQARGWEGVRSSPAEHCTSEHFKNRPACSGTWSPPQECLSQGIQAGAGRCRACGKHVSEGDRKGSGGGVKWS
uniref:Uncharacterized protein n=1 Tax=Colobus angolensis palliatus TaxID=336983 RepID=A0A2K5K342_COLAP